MNKFKPNTKQREAYNQVIKAIRRANKAGLVFYGKSGNLVAYTKHTDDYVEKHGFEQALRGQGRQLYNLSEDILRDSGADDFPYFIKNEDDPDYEP